MATETKNDETKDFEILWQSSVKEPPAKEIAVKKIEIDLSMDALLDKFSLLTEKYLQQGKIKKADYDEILVQIGSLKKVLTKIGERELLANQLAMSTKRRALQITDEITRLNSQFLNLLRK